MRVGQFDAEITFQIRTEIQDAESGEVTFTWADCFTTYAQIIKQKATEKSYIFTEARSDTFINATSDITIFQVRYDPEIDDVYRISWKNKFFNIKSVREIGRNQFLEIEAQAIDGGQLQN